MPLESVTHISDLVVTNPTSTDPKSEGDNHLRAIKTALKTDFPNISGTVTKTHTQLNNTLDKTGDTMTGPLAQAAGAAALPSYTFSGDTNTGIYSPGADQVAVAIGGTQALLVDAARNVGVGVAPSAWNNTYIGFDIGSTGTLYSRTGVNNGLDIAANGFRAASDGLWKYKITGPASRILLDGSTGSLIFYRAPSGTAGTTITWEQPLAIDNSGNVLVTGSGGLGYGVGSGGTVTQATSRTTGVTLNKPSGAITLFSTTTTAGTFASFTLTNSSIAATDGVEVCFASGATADRYGLLVTAVAAGSCRIQIHNIAAVGVAEAPVIRFNVIKGASS